jgi:phage-related protein
VIDLLGSADTMGWWRMPRTEVRAFKDRDTVPIDNWLEELRAREPKVYAKCLARILRLAEVGHELQRPESAPLRDGIHELRIGHKHVNYRILYFFFGKSLACLSHGLTKEDKVPDNDIETAILRKKLVASDPDKYTADWEV